MAPVGTRRGQHVPARRRLRPGSRPPAGRDAGRPVPGVRAVDYGIRGMHLAYDCWPAWTCWCWWTRCRRVRTPARGRSRPTGAGQHPGAAGRAGRTSTAARPWIRTAWIRSRSWAASARSAANCPLTYVVGCVPADLTEGIGLTAPVAAAVPRAMAAVVDLISEHSTRHVRTQPVPERKGSDHHVPWNTWPGHRAARGLRRTSSPSWTWPGCSGRSTSACWTRARWSRARWVLIHMGFALERVDSAGADRAMGGLELMGRPRDLDGDAG